MNIESTENKTHFSLEMEYFNCPEKILDTLASEFDG